MVVPAARRAAAAVVGAAGVFASARLYVVPGRPAWDTPLTVVRFCATAPGVGPLLTGHLPLAAARRGPRPSPPPPANWAAALAPRPTRPWRGSVAARAALVPPVDRAAPGARRSASAWPSPASARALVVLVAGELIGRWLFYVTVVPLNMPGSFWRHTVAGQR